MNKYKKAIYAFSTAAMTFVLTGCAADSPFNTEGDGSLHLRMVVSSEVTRSDVDQNDLAQKTLIYISDAKGLLHKYKGLDNVPASIPLRTGSYLAEAWTGDSLPASFDKKFYKAIQPFEITRGGISSVVLNCKIANVVASVRPAENLKGKLNNYTVTVASTTGTLDFNEDNVATARGFYMMADGDSTLNWSISGENADGKSFTKTGKINNVKPAHEYILNLSYNPNVSGDDTGGGFITVTVNDEELLIEDNITLYAAPTIVGEGFDVNTPLAGATGTFADRVLKFYAHEGFSALTFKIPDAATFGLPATEFDLTNLTDAAAASLRNAGLAWQFVTKSEQNQINAQVTFPADMLNRLPNGEYPVTIIATDNGGRTRTLNWSINVSDAAVEALEADPAEIRSYSATLRGMQIKAESTNPGFEYRAQGQSEWTRVNALVTRASAAYHVKLTGLIPGSIYEYRAVADGYTHPKIFTFKTEPIFIIPNAGMEQWSTNSKGAVIPSADGNVSFWDSGNHGSITMSINLTQSANDIIHGGSASARLASQFVGLGGIAGKFAAGNLFAGSFDGLDGMDGILTFGRPFNGTHPIKLRGWINYRPGIVEYAGGGVAKGDTDQGMIYVALANKTYQILTKKQKQLFDPNDAGILAYGEMILTSAYGSDGAMAQFEIEITPRAGYETAKPEYIILVASASRYGDYFAGGSSVLYIDDLELVYE